MSARRTARRGEARSSKTSSSKTHSSVKAGASPFARRLLRRERANATRSRTHTTYSSTFGETGLGLTTAHMRAQEAGLIGRLVFAIGKLWARLRRQLKRWGRWLGSTVTGIGWSVLLVAVIGLSSGYAWGWVEALFVGYAAVVFMGIALLFMIGRSIYAVELSMKSERVIVGENAPGTIAISNPTKRRLFPETVEVPVGEGLAEFRLPSLAPGSRFVGEFSVPTVKRAVIMVGPVRSVRADPLLLLRRELVWTNGMKLFVHPITASIPSTNTGLVRDLEGNPTRDLTNSDVSFHALREYAPGDDRRHIHWKSTARTGQMMVRQYEQTRRSQLLIQLSTASVDYFSEEEFELAVSVAGSLGIRAIRDGRDTAVTVGDELSQYSTTAVPTATKLRVTTPSRLLDDLSGVEHREHSLPLVVLSKVSVSVVSGISVAFLVFGSIPTAAQIRAASLAFPLDTEVVAVVCNPGIVPSAKRIDGLTVLTVGYLDDLTRSLSKTAA